MDNTRITLDEFIKRYPPAKRRESVISAHKKEILLLRGKGYSIPEIVTFFDLVIGQKVSRFAVRDYLSSLKKKMKKNPTPQEAKTSPPSDTRKTGKETPPEPQKPLSRPAKQQGREALASRYDT